MLSNYHLKPMRTFSLFQVNTERQICCMLGLYQASLKATSPALLWFFLFSSCIAGWPRTDYVAKGDFKLILSFQVRAIRLAWLGAGAGSQGIMHDRQALGPH